MNRDNQFEQDITHIRARVEIFEKRCFQMVLWCAAGFTTVVSVSNYVPLLLIPFILFLILMTTENYYYTSVRNIHFLNEYLIEICKRKNVDYIFEDAYKYIFFLSKYADEMPSLIKRFFRGIFKIIFYPFITLPIFYLSYTVYHIFFLQFEYLRQLGLFPISILTFFYFGSTGILVKKTINR
jgi:hypothetical protein